MAQINTKIFALKNAIDRRVKQVDKYPYLLYKSGGLALVGDKRLLEDDNYPSVGVFDLQIDFCWRIAQFICNIAIILSN